MGFEMKAGTGGLVVRIQEAQFEVKWPYNGWKSIIFVGLLLKKKKTVSDLNFTDSECLVLCLEKFS